MNDQDNAGSEIEPIVMPLWPDVGRKLGLSRNGVYDAARNNQIPGLIRIGRLHRVVKSVFYRELGITDQGK